MENLANTPVLPHLFATVVRLRPLEPGSIAANHGHHAHGAFLDIVRCVEPELAERLHTLDERKPFTLSPLQGFTHRPEDGRVWVTPEDELWLRFTLLDHLLFRTVAARFLQGSTRPEIMIGRVRFLVASLVTALGNDPWAGYTSFGELSPGDDHPLSTSVTLHFASPTTFSFGKRKVPLPLPELVFGSLLKKWNTFSPVELPRGLLALFKEQLAVSEIHNLSTEMLDFGRYKEKGFLGRVTFEALGTWSKGELRDLNTLANFAFYAGVGYKTTMGMGLTRRILNPTKGEGQHGPV